jgi:hypothetical protein
LLTKKKISLLLCIGEAFILLVYNNYRQEYIVDELNGSGLSEICRKGRDWGGWYAKGRSVEVVKGKVR